MIRQFTFSPLPHTRRNIFERRYTTEILYYMRSACPFVASWLISLRENVRESVRKIRQMCKYAVHSATLFDIHGEALYI